MKLDDLLQAWATADPKTRKKLGRRIVRMREAITAHGGRASAPSHKGHASALLNADDEDDHFYGAWWGAGGAGRARPRTAGQVAAASGNAWLQSQQRRQARMKAAEERWRREEAAKKKTETDKLVKSLQGTVKPSPGSPTKLLKKGMKELGGGISKTWKYTDKNGKQWVVKRSARQENGTRHELGAWIVNDGMGGFLPMPKIHATAFNGDIVSVSEFVTSATVANEFSAEQAALRKLGIKTENIWRIPEDKREAYDKLVSEISDHRFATRDDLDPFDYILANNDRHGGNYMFRDDGQVVAIDHDLAFNDWTPSKPYHFSDRAKDGIRQLLANQAIIELRLRNIGLPDEDIDGVFQRATELKNEFDPAQPPRPDPRSFGPADWNPEGL